MHELTKQLQQDRQDDAVFRISHAEQEAELRNTIKADNWKLPPVPKAPCVRVKSTGEILPWTDGFAARPDLVDPCDSQGNILRGEAIPAPQPVKLNTDISRKPVGDEHTTAVGMASQVLGVEANFSQDFTEQTTVKEALPLPEQTTAVAVDDLVKAVFKAQEG